MKYDAHYPSMANVPERYPAVALDRIIASAEEQQCAELMIQLEMDFGHPLDGDRLARACALLVSAHPILGCRFAAGHQEPCWESVNNAGSKILACAASRPDYEAFRVAAIDSRSGPQAAACLYHSPHGDHLIIKATHVVCDVAGLFDIVLLLSSIYSRLNDDPCYRPQPCMPAFRGLDQIMRHVPWHAYPTVLRNVLGTLWTNLIPATTHTLTLPAGEREPRIYVMRHLSEPRAARLRKYAAGQRATLNDALLAGFHRALAVAGQWDGRAALRAQMLVDLRRWYLKNRPAEGICNLLGYEYTNLGTDLGCDVTTTLARVSAITRRRKASWFGLTDNCCGAILNLMPYHWMAKAVRAMVAQGFARRSIPNALTNAGEVQTSRVRFDQQPLRAWFLPPIVYPPQFIAGVSSYNGSLTFSSGVPASAQPAVAHFFDCLMAELPA